MAGTLHNEFTCDFSGAAWHRQVLALKLEATRTASGSLERLLLEEADQIVRARAATKEA